VSIRETGAYGPLQFQWRIEFKSAGRDEPGLEADVADGSGNRIGVVGPHSELQLASGQRLERTQVFVDGLVGIGSVVGPQRICHQR